MKTHLRVAGLWIENGAVLLESLVDREIWGVPGGQLEDGESLDEAVRREYFEELGLTIRVIRLAIIHENFWQSKGAMVREYGFYFVVEPEPARDERNPVMRSREAVLKFEWFGLNELERIVMVPEFLKRALPGLNHDGTLFIGRE